MTGSLSTFSDFADEVPSKSATETKVNFGTKKTISNNLRIPLFFKDRLSRNFGKRITRSKLRRCNSVSISFSELLYSTHKSENR